MIERAQAQLSRWVYELVLSSYAKYFNLGRNQVDGDDIHAVWEDGDPAGGGEEHAEVGHEASARLASLVPGYILITAVSVPA